MEQVLAADGRSRQAPIGACIRVVVAALVLTLGTPPAPCAAADLLDRLGESRETAAEKRFDNARALPSDSRPRLHGSLSSPAVRNLRLGHALALGMVRSRPTCRALFTPLAGSGVESISTTHYAATTDRDRARVCAGGVAAFTTVGGRVTWLCPEFGHLGPRAAALTLIHEALHSAGMAESPSTAGALTALEIDALVARACGAPPAGPDATEVVARLP